MEPSPVRQSRLARFARDADHFSTCWHAGSVAFSGIRAPAWLDELGNRDTFDVDPRALEKLTTGLRDNDLDVRLARIHGDALAVARRTGALA